MSVRSKQKRVFKFDKQKMNMFEYVRYALKLMFESVRCSTHHYWSFDESIIHYYCKQEVGIHEIWKLGFFNKALKVQKKLQKLDYLDDKRYLSSVLWKDVLNNGDINKMY